MITNTIYGVFALLLSSFGYHTEENQETKTAAITSKTTSTIIKPMILIFLLYEMSYAIQLLVKDYHKWNFWIQYERYPLWMITFMSLYVTLWSLYTVIISVAFMLSSIILFS